MQKWLLAVVVVLSGSVLVSDSFANNSDVRQARRRIENAGLDKACEVKIEKERNDGELTVIVEGFGRQGDTLITNCYDRGPLTRCTRVSVLNEGNSGRSCILSQFRVVTTDGVAGNILSLHQAKLTGVPLTQECTLAYFDKNEKRSQVLDSRICVK